MRKLALVNGSDIVGKKEQQKKGREHTDEDSAREGPFLSATHDGEREPVRGDERMQKRHRRDASDLGQIFSAESFHLLSLLFFLFFLAFPELRIKLMAAFDAVAQSLNYQIQKVGTDSGSLRYITTTF